MALFRYPGGKSKFYDRILPYFRLIDSDSCTFIEPFTGGGSVSLAVAKKYPRVKLILNDREPCMYSFWQIVAGGAELDFVELVKMMEPNPTIEKFNQLREMKPSGLLDQAFRAMFFNHTTYGGRFEAGPMGGQKQDGKSKITDRWNSLRLIEEMHEARRLLVGRTTVLNQDFEAVIALSGAQGFIYCDPPYVKAGNGLYVGRWTEADHIRLRDALKNKSNWALSYDDHPLVRDLYQTLERPITVNYPISKSRKTELLLFVRLEFPTDTNPNVGVDGISDTARIWIKGYGPND
jgi:DNA adenine methylase